MGGRSDGRPLATAQMIGSLATGGAEHLAVRIANARAAAGGLTHLYVLDGPGPLSARVSPDVVVRHIDQRVAAPTRPAACLSSVIAGYRRLTAQLDADGIDVLQTHLPGPNFWGLLLATAGRRTVVPTVHSNREFDYGAPGALRDRARRWAYRRMLGSCAAVIAVSEPVRDSLLDALGWHGRVLARLHVVPNGVPIPPPATADERERTRARYGCAPGEVLLLAAGRHIDLKNYELLVDVAADLHAAGRAVRLVLAGEGPLTDRYRERAAARGFADRLTLPGDVNDLTSLMHAADAFVIASRWEGLSLVMLEAMACGLPVVGTRIPGVTDLVRDGVSGVLAAPDDPVDLARALARLLDDPALAAACRQAARTRVERDFSIERVLRDLDHLYRRARAREGAR